MSRVDLRASHAPTSTCQPSLFFLCPDDAAPRPHPLLLCLNSDLDKSGISEKAGEFITAMLVEYIGLSWFQFDQVIGLNCIQCNHTRGLERSFYFREDAFRIVPEVQNVDRVYLVECTCWIRQLARITLDEPDCTCSYPACSLELLHSAFPGTCLFRQPCQKRPDGSLPIRPSRSRIRSPTHDRCLSARAGRASKPQLRDWPSPRSSPAKRPIMPVGHRICSAWRYAASFIARSSSRSTRRRLNPAYVNPHAR